MRLLGSYVSQKGTSQHFIPQIVTNGFIINDKLSFIYLFIYLLSAVVLGSYTG
jgi:hypothetical protein